ncbi:ATP-binding protein [Labedaea rhizosphaerae]|uniref:Putative ATPase n=1 Tax=Labedaea rhizosphaerae TaxID=598644 RepID=A0A4V3CZH2_LABRH|nr:AAA family ATPase [Labedaea rhizosphaerae]TDP97998.1 putative ATPase [Labedaea rhizosphaerae]
MLQVTLLGEQVLTDPDGAVRLRSSRTLELIAFLVVHSDSPQPRQRIATLFWPDSSDEQALTNLRRELHHLRAVLGDAKSLEVTTRDLCWRDTTECVVDVRAFGAARAAALASTDSAGFLRHAEEAVRHYGGDFLPGSHDDWALEIRNALEQQCVDLLDRIADGQRDLDTAVAAAKRRIQLRPLEEVGYRTLMKRQGDLGDRAGAVSTYHHCASVLERELGVEPDPVTRKTLSTLLARGEPAVSTRRQGRAGTRLIGRTTEFSALLELWRTASEGRPSLALIRGDAGVGKSRLMTELAGTAARAGAVVANAQCFGTAGRLALAPVADWLRTPAVRAGLGGLAPVWRTEVDRIAPSARTRADPGPSTRAMAEAWQRHRFFEGLTRALLAVDRPILLTLDNLHWADPETLAFITFGLSLNPRAPIMVAATMRDEFTDHEPGLDQWIDRMRATGSLNTVALSPFDAQETAHLVESVTGHRPSPQDAAMVHATTGGFPFYIVEAARSGDGEATAADLTTVLDGRLEQVSGPARQVIELAAAVGRDFSLDLLTEAADLDADGVVAAVDELWRRRILHECGDCYYFSHDLLRAAAYDRISPPRRWLLHRRIAQGLELLHPDNPDAVSAQLAEQYARGGRGERAIAYYRRAADVAAGRFAHSEAIRLHEAALALVRELPEGLDRTAKELELLEATAGPMNAAFGYSSPRLRQTLTRTIALAEELGRPHSVLDALIGLWASLFVHGDAVGADRTATRILALATPGSQLLGSAHFALGGSSVSRGRLAEGLRHFALAAEHEDRYSLRIGNRSDVHGPAWAAHAHWLGGDDDRALATAASALSVARTGDNPFSLALALSYGAITHQLRGDRGALAAVLAELTELCARYELAYYCEWALILGGWLRGDEAGLAAAKRGIDNLTAAEAFARMPYWLALVAELQNGVGRPGEARATLDAAIATAHTRDDVWWLPEVLRLRAAHDDETGAVKRLRAAAELATEHGSVALARRCAADLAARGVAFDVRPAALAGER